MRERILASIVVVAAVVGDLFSRLTADTAKQYQGPYQAAKDLNLRCGWRRIKLQFFSMFMWKILLVLYADALD